MLTTGEVGALYDARQRALAAVQAARAAVTQSWFGSLLFPDRATRQADAMEATLSAIDGVRDGLVETPEDDHDAVLAVVQHYEELADPAFSQRFEVTATNVEDTALTEAVDLYHRARAAIPSPSDLKPWIIGGAVLVGVIALAWLTSSAARLKGATS